MADVTECNTVRRTAESLNKESLFSCQLRFQAALFDPRASISGMFFIKKKKSFSGIHNTSLSRSLFFNAAYISLIMVMECTKEPRLSGFAEINTCPASP